MDRDTLRPIDAWRLGSQTNVYGVGMVLHCLIMLNTDPGAQTYWFGDGRQDDENGQLNLRARAAQMEGKGHVANYSNRLLNLIQQCLRYEPSRRPTFVRILQRVRNRTSPQAAPDLSLGLKDGMADLATKNANTVLSHPNPYRYGLAREEIEDGVEDDEDGQ